jgi:phosphonatase-like hydrolase
MDMAGTTVSDPGLVLGALRAALESIGLDDVADEEIAARMGLHKLDALTAIAEAHGSDAEAAELALDHFNRVTLYEIMQGRFRPVPGARQAIQRLLDAGLKVAFTTGFPEAIMQAILDHVGWSELVGTAVSSEQVEAGRPAPYLIQAAMRATGVSDPSEVASVGDAPSDLASGRAAGVRWNFGVLSGAHTAESLQPGPNDRVMTDVVAVVDALLGD